MRGVANSEMPLGDAPIKIDGDDTLGAQNRHFVECTAKGLLAFSFRDDQVLKADGIGRADQFLQAQGRSSSICGHGDERSESNAD